LFGVFRRHECELNDSKLKVNALEKSLRQEHPTRPVFPSISQRRILSIISGLTGDRLSTPPLQ
jgi:hypothetical protein